MDLRFPVELQKRFEQAVVSGELAERRLLDALTLASQFRATANEVNQVLLAEYRKGLVNREANGLFRILGIAKPSIDSVFQHTARQGLAPSSDVRAVEIEPATASVADKLELAVGAPVYRQERTRVVNGEAVGNQRNYIPFEVCPGLEHDDISRSSFQELLEAKYHAIIADKREEFALLPANNGDLQILGLASGSKVLVVQRLSLSVNAKPLVWADIHIRTDRYAYVSKLWPQAAKLIKEQ